MTGYYKVLRRQVYCETLRGWLAEMIYCHIVLRLRPWRSPEIGSAS